MRIRHGARRGRSTARDPSRTVCLSRRIASAAKNAPSLTARFCTHRDRLFARLPLGFSQWDGFSFIIETIRHGQLRLTRPVLMYFFLRSENYPVRDAGAIAVGLETV